MAVQSMGDQFFTGTGLAVDQHADGGTRQAAYYAKNVLHCWRFADNIGRWAIYWRISRLLLFLIMADCAVDQRHRFINIKRFWQIIKGTLLISADRRVQI